MSTLSTDSFHPLFVNRTFARQSSWILHVHVLLCFHSEPIDPSVLELNTIPSLYPYVPLSENLAKALAIANTCYESVNPP